MVWKTLQCVLRCGEYRWVEIWMHCLLLAKWIERLLYEEYFSKLKDLIEAEVGSVFVEGDVQQDGMSSAKSVLNPPRSWKKVNGIRDWRVPVRRSVIKQKQEKVRSWWHTVSQVKRVTQVMTSLIVCFEEFYFSIKNCQYKIWTISYCVVDSLS